MSDWQPIETAPSSAPILCYMEGFDMAVLKRDFGPVAPGWWWLVGDGDLWEGPDPTHWMPLPLPPLTHMQESE